MTLRSAQGEGERRWFLGTLATIRVPGEAVGGRYSLIEFVLPHLASPPRHTHPQDETFIVAEGELTVVAGDERFTVSAGDIAAFPGGTPHSFRVDSDGARVLTLSTPAGLDAFVRDLSVPATAPTLPPPEAPRPAGPELERLFAAHRTVNVGPPLGPDD